MTDPTTVFDLSPKGVAKLRAELARIFTMFGVRDLDPEYRATLTRRRARIIAALHTLEG